MNDNDALTQIPATDWNARGVSDMLRSGIEHNTEAAQRNWKTSAQYWKTHNGREASKQRIGRWIYDRPEEEEEVIP